MATGNYDQILQNALYSVQQTFPGQINTDELRDVVQGIFPLSKDDFSIINVKGTTSCFKTSVKCVLKNKSCGYFYY